MTAKRKLRKTSKIRHTVSRRVTAEIVRRRLKLKHFKAKNSFTRKHPHVDRILKEKGLDPAKLREHSAKVIGAGVITGSVLLSTPNVSGILPTADDLIGISRNKHVEKRASQKDVVVDSLKSILPKKIRPLERNEEKLIEQIFEKAMGVKSRASLEGEHLNTTYGRIGAEQHLRRYPGDTYAQHANDPSDDISSDILDEGMVSGLGAWGYFSNSKEGLTPDLVETEKWYAVAQTLYLPDWNMRQPYLKNWYKHRKVLLVNTENGNALVAAIADAGPAAFTGKHYGGSPEVMDSLGGDKYKKGPVIMFFVDDPDNEVPLGPVEY